MIGKYVLISLVFSYFLISCGDTKPVRSGQTSPSALTIDDSISLITDKIKKDSANHILFKKRAELFIRKGQLDPAFRDVNQSIELNREDPDVYLLLGDIYFILGQTDNSLNAYKKAYSLNPKNVEPLLNLAEAYLVLENYPESSRYLDIAASLDVNQPKTYYLKGILQMETGDTLSALTNLRIAGNLDSLYFEAFMQTGSLLSALKDSTAVEYYRAALKARPNDERAMFLTALAVQEKGNVDEALDLYINLVQIYPGNKNAHFNIGYIYLVEKEEFENAVSSFQAAVEIDPAFLRAVYNLGLSYETLGDFSNARQQYRRALELEANYPLAIDALNRLDEIESPSN